MRRLWSKLIGFVVMWVFPIVVLLMIDTSSLLCRINHKYSWKLTGKEILLQLEHRHGKHPQVFMPLILLSVIASCNF